MMNNDKPVIVINPDRIIMYDNNGDEICSMGREPTCQVQKITPVDFTEFIPPKKGNEKMRNEVLDLYVSRKRDQIKEKYKSMTEEKYNNLEAVKRYEELINSFDASLEELIHEYPAVDGEVPMFVRTGYSNDYRYEVNRNIKDAIAKEYKEEADEELAEVSKLENEVRAMLSISSDKDYQLDVLEKYGITKKGKLNI